MACAATTTACQPTNCKTGRPAPPSRAIRSRSVRAWRAKIACWCCARAKPWHQAAASSDWRCPFLATPLPLPPMKTAAASLATSPATPAWRAAGISACPTPWTHRYGTATRAATSTPTCRALAAWTCKPRPNTKASRKKWMPTRWRTARAKPLTTSPAKTACPKPTTPAAPPTGKAKWR